MNDIKAQITEALKNNEYATFIFEYKGASDKVEQTRYIKIVKDIGKEYEKNGVVLKGGTSFVSGTNGESVFDKNGELYLRAFPTSLDPKGISAHDKLFKLSNIKNFRPFVSTIKEINGDIIALAKEGKFDVIAQGCNCFNTMGSGLAAQIRKKCPNAYAADQATVVGDKNKLGTYTKATEKEGFTVLNCYTQYGFGENSTNPNGGPVLKVPVDYVAISKALKALRAEFPGKRIGLPRIGCGLAGGDFEVVRQIITDTLEGEDVTIVTYEQPNFSI